MPIVDVELVTRAHAQDVPSEETIRRLADELGAIFGSPPKGTWVRLRFLPEHCYAENQQQEAEYPVFVTVLKAQLPTEGQLAEEVGRITRVVAARVSRPEANVHVLYEPRAAGRIAFGGNLRTE